MRGKVAIAAVKPKTCHYFVNFNNSPFDKRDVISIIASPC